MQRRITPILAHLVVMALAVAVPSRSAAQTNPASIGIPALGTQGIGSIYPSSVLVEAAAGTGHTSSVGVVLHGLTHPCPEDLAILLVHNNTDKYLLLSNAGSCRPFLGTDLTIRSGGAVLADEQTDTPAYGTVLQIGAINYGVSPVFPAPAPPPPYLLGMPPPTVNVNGVWSLYVMDTRAGARGVMAAGWSLTYNTDIERESAHVNVAIPSGAGTMGPAAAYPMTFNLNSVSPEAIVESVRFDMEIEHDRVEDLRIVLQSPTGTAVVLMANAGGNNAFAPGTTLTFYDNTASAIPNSNLLLGDTYRPGGAYGPPATHTIPLPGPAPPFETAFAAFENQPAIGNWRLWVFDAAATNTGAIAWARLRITTQRPMDTAIVSPVPIGVVPSTRPFVRVELATDNVELSDSVWWRVSNGPAFDFYDAGAFTRVPGTETYVANVPVKAGVNDITALIRTRSGSLNMKSLQVGVDGFSYSLAEGATGPFFDLDITAANFADPVAPIWVDFLQESGPVVTVDTDVGGNFQRHLHVDEITPEASVSTVVRSIASVPLAVERTMIWDDRGYGGHGGTSTDPATRWLFAEGSQGFFATYILLANNNAVEANVSLKFLLEGGGVVNHAVVVPPKARRTVYAGDIPALANQSFGLDVTSALPIIAERAMYMPGARLFEGGHGSAGVNQPERNWYLAEGATGPFFESFILLSNPDSEDAQVSLRYLLPDGTALPQAVVVPANGRLTINVETVHPLLSNTPVSTAIGADRGIIVERAMYWPDITQGWQEAHNSFGLAETALRWGVADGRVGGPRGFETYVLLANPNATPAEVLVRFLKADGVVQQEYTLPPTSRLNVQASLVPGLGEGSFSAEVRVLNYQPIAVEKAMYWNADGAIWAGGTNVTATRLPPP